MSALAHRPEYVSVEDYLAEEAVSEVKREYLGGLVYAMAGAGEPHNRIATNLLGLLHGQLRGSRCEAFGSDMQVRLVADKDTYFYYPDAMIACDPADSGHGWRERPSALFEIVSKESRRVDEREKRLAYQSIAELQAYVLIEQDKPEALIYTRISQGWESDRVSGLAGVARLPDLSVSFSLADLYERVTFKEYTAWQDLMRVGAT